MSVVSEKLEGGEGEDVIDNPPKLAGNQNKLQSRLDKQLTHRPNRQQLVNTNILQQSRADPTLQPLMKNLEIAKSQDKLQSRLKRRQSPSHLMHKGILLVDPKEQVNGQLQAAIASRVAQKEDGKNLLAKFMVERPSMRQLVQEHENLIPEHTMVWSLSITDGLVPSPRNCHSLTHVRNSRNEDKLYLLGGYGSDRGNALLVYDVRNNTWSQPLVAGRAPLDRYSHTCVAVGSQLVLWGGYSMSEHWLNDLHFLDTDFVQSFKPPIGVTQGGDSSEMLLWYQSKVQGTPPCPRAAHSATVVGKKVFFFAGNDGKHLFNDLHILDTEIMVWSRSEMSGNVPAPRAGHTASLVGSKIVIFGGGTEMGPVNDLHILETNTMCWEAPEQHGMPPAPRAGHSCITVFKTHILVFGGGFLDKAFNDLHLFDVESATWSRPNDSRAPIPRAGHSCTSCGDRLFLFGGGDSERVYNDLLCLDTAPTPPMRSNSGSVDSYEQGLTTDNEEEPVSIELTRFDIEVLLDKIAFSSTRVMHLLDTTASRVEARALEHKHYQEELRLMVQRLESAHLVQYDALLLEVETVKKAVAQEMEELRSYFDKLRQHHKKGALGNSILTGLQESDESSPDPLSVSSAISSSTSSQHASHILKISEVVSGKTKPRSRSAERARPASAQRTRFVPLSEIEGGKLVEVYGSASRSRTKHSGNGIHTSSISSPDLFSDCSLDPSVSVSSSIRPPPSQPTPFLQG
eukprot:gb/GEZN01002765.1/.p1 GENE.gb/GEZN01002765.1/~~gb/GEZN01002765.1/.p1  ORF type:complete len:741 (-),score=48.93 gb/GEZN01002765.1/:38-2260(-)